MMERKPKSFSLLLMVVITMAISTAVVLYMTTHWLTRPKGPVQFPTGGPAEIIGRHIPVDEYLYLSTDKNNNVTHIRDSKSVEHFFVYNDLNQLVHYINTNGTDVKFKYFGDEWYVDDDSSCDWVIK